MPSRRVRATRRARRDRHRRLARHGRAGPGDHDGDRDDAGAGRAHRPQSASLHEDVRRECAHPAPRRHARRVAEAMAAVIEEIVSATAAPIRRPRPAPSRSRARHLRESQLVRATAANMPASPLALVCSFIALTMWGRACSFIMFLAPQEPVGVTGAAAAGAALAATAAVAATDVRTARRGFMSAPFGLAPPCAGSPTGRSSPALAVACRRSPRATQRAPGADDQRAMLDPAWQVRVAAGGGRRRGAAAAAHARARVMFADMRVRASRGRTRIRLPRCVVARRGSGHSYVRSGRLRMPVMWPSADRSRRG